MGRPSGSGSAARFIIIAIPALALACPGAAAAADPEALPEGAGLSAKYPHDAGIARDPAVLFAEDFETGSLQEVVKRWDDQSNHEKKVLSLADDAPAGSGGKRSLGMTATLGEN